MSSVDHKCTDWQTSRDVLECNKYMFENAICCDVTFKVGNPFQIVRAHKYVLSSRSPVFFAMFNGQLAENPSQAISIPDIPHDAFVELMRYLYYQKVNITADNVFPLMYASKKYIIPKLTQLSSTFLSQHKNVSNVATLVEQALHFDEKALVGECMDFIDQHISNVLKHDDFLNISQKTLCEILKRDTLLVSELDLIKACIEWAKVKISSDDSTLQNTLGGITLNDTPGGSIRCDTQECSPSHDTCGITLHEALGPALYLLRFPTLNCEEFSKVSDTGVLNEQDELAIYRAISRPDKSQVDNFSSVPREGELKKKDIKAIPLNYNTHCGYSDQFGRQAWGFQRRQCSVVCSMIYDCVIQGVLVKQLINAPVYLEVAGNASSNITTDNTVVNNDKFGRVFLAQVNPPLPVTIGQQIDLITRSELRNYNSSHGRLCNFIKNIKNTDDILPAQLSCFCHQCSTGNIVAIVVSNINRDSYNGNGHYRTFSKFN